MIIFEIPLFEKINCKTDPLKIIFKNIYQVKIDKTPRTVIKKNPNFCMDYFINEKPENI